MGSVTASKSFSVMVQTQCQISAQPARLARWLPRQNSNLQSNWRRRQATNAVGASLGIDEIYADHSPAVTLAAVAAEQRCQPTMMVGDRRVHRIMSIRLDSTKLVGKPTWPIHIKLPNPARGGRETGAAGFIHETHRVYASIEGGSR